MWHQRSRNMWITDGDRNTNFFHQKAFNCKQQNVIHGFSDLGGDWQDDDQVVEGIILDYFTSSFSSNDTTDMAVLLNVVQLVVTEAINDYLTCEFSLDEVHRALKQMLPKKSPGPNGMSPLFYQHFWSLTSECITRTVLDFLNLGIIPPKFNETHIVLIPKIKKPHKDNTI